jgi:murein DD-endopeptidase MepM/ murein hydrolase activator NlpD
MNRTVGSSLLAGVIATIVAFLLPTINPRANATLPVNSKVSPLTMMADSMRTVTTELDNEISTLVTTASEATEIIEGSAIESNEARWLEQRLRDVGNELSALPRPDNDDAFRLNDRISTQQRFIDEMHSLLDQRNALVEHLPTLLPAHGRFTSEFGYRIHPISGVRKMHDGVDIAAPTGTPIYAAASGTVAFAGVRRGYGNFIELDHGFGYTTHYGHASKLLVKAGETVKRGQLIALVGSTGASTGSHLHFEVLVDSVHVNPVAFIAPQITETPTLADASVSAPNQM